MEIEGYEDHSVRELRGVGVAVCAGSGMGRFWCRGYGLGGLQYGGVGL